ncbi:MAG: putative toxin-antitoxin system toxin component, PIN family [bacterium]
MKVVLDTNVLISALFWQGPPHNLLKLIEKGDLTLCLTPLLIEELRDVLKRPFFSSFITTHKTSSEKLIAAIFEIAELYPDKAIEAVIKDDPDDDKVLSCALVSGAKFIITGDTHILNLTKWADISILTPQQFLNGLKEY